MTLKTGVKQPDHELAHERRVLATTGHVVVITNGA